MTDDDLGLDGRALLDALPEGTMHLSGYLVGDITVMAYYQGTTVVAVGVTRADPYAYMSMELFENSDANHLHVDGDTVSFGTEGLGLGVVSYRLLHRDEQQKVFLLERVQRGGG